MGLVLRRKLLGQAAAKAEQWRFCARCSTPREWSRPGSRPSDGESRRPGTAATRDGGAQPLGHRKRVCYPTPGPHDASNPELMEDLMGWVGEDWRPRVGSFGWKKRGRRTLEEGWGEELSRLAKSPLLFNSTSHCIQLRRVCSRVSADTVLTSSTTSPGARGHLAAPRRAGGPRPCESRSGTGIRDRRGSAIRPWPGSDLARQPPPPQR
jgi:hypothetical protein